jgi:hypothetical protein
MFLARRENTTMKSWDILMEGPVGVDHSRSE